MTLINRDGWYYLETKCIISYDLLGLISCKIKCYWIMPTAQGLYFLTTIILLPVGTSNWLKLTINILHLKCRGVEI